MFYACEHAEHPHAQVDVYIHVHNTRVYVCTRLGMETFRAWAAARQLSEETISILIANAVDREALGELTPQDLPELGLRLGQLGLVHRLVGIESAPAGASPRDASSSALSLVQSLRYSHLTMFSF